MWMCDGTLEDRLQIMIEKNGFSGVLALFALTASAVLMPQLASAQKKPEKPAAPAAQPAGPVQLATFGEWGAYAADAEGKGRICYVLAKPKERLPKDLKRDDGFLFISTRPAEGVRNEISFVLGFPTKDASSGEMVLGSTKYTVSTKGTSAWLKNAADDSNAIELMKKNKTMTVKTSSAKGNATTDHYNLAGLQQALDRIKKECP